MSFAGSSVFAIARRLWRAPLFTVVALVTLAIGIGANAAMFAVVNGVLLKPLPFDDPGRLVSVWHSAAGLGIDRLPQSPSTYLVYREESRTFDDIALWNETSVSVTGLGTPERVEALRVTDGLLSVLRVAPMLGRDFTRADDSPGSPDYAVLSHAYWQRRFGGDPGAVGRTLVVDGRVHEIIGVLPQDFRFLSTDPGLLVTFKFNPAELYVGQFSYPGIARLRPDATVDQAGADVARMIPLLPERFPFPPGLTRQMFEETRMAANIRPLAADVIGDVDRVLWLLLGTVALVLLIACANVANLFLVRAEGRQRELAIRRALGAGWGTIARELLSESLLLGVGGGLLGIVLASWSLRLLLALAPAGLPRREDISIDGTVLLFTLAVSIVAGLLFGLIPVLRYGRQRGGIVSVEGGRTVSEGRQRHAARNGLVVSQIALALVLLVASGLLIRTFQAMRDVNPGFVRPSEVLTLRLSVPEAAVRDAEQVARTHEQILRRLEEIPGVTSVGLSTSITLDGALSYDPIFVEEFPAPEGQLPPMRRFKWIGEGYFQTMGNPVVAGRDLTWTDIHTAARVVVVSENFARQYWKEPAAALGKRIRQSPENPWREIVGVVGNERDEGLAVDPPLIVYWPMLVKEFWTEPVFAARDMAYAVRSPRLSSATFLEEVQRAVWSVNKDLPLSSVRTLAEIQARSMSQTSFALVMLATAGGVALLLGIVGIYGVVAYVAAQRTREIGIRMALGADPSRVTGLFVRHGLVLVAIGLAVGLAAAAGVTRVMATLLFGVSPLDPVTFAAAAIGLGLAALVASYVPARRAARVDPVTALRIE